ncbi:hypothetical protein BGZ97_005422 [Linnemannia gamsii]|uniref:Uncharacterized protein n=1 Tax=Linnemannia gamsii TaxID=64522 RepID=A0A9P6QUI8_9FUNG|nr:hypothetical protein BGZ97_005422 [Linnemannia gamsii]
MAHAQEHPTQFLHDNNIYDYANEDDDYDDLPNYFDDIDMSSPIVSFGDPNLDEIAQQISLVVFNLTLDNNIQDDNGVEFEDDFVDNDEDLFMPNIVESFEEPDNNDVAWQVALIVINDVLDEIIHDHDGQEALYF